MSYRCPACLRKAALEVSWWIELPPDVRSDEITLQLVGCPACGFRGAVVYQESRRGALDAESWEYDGYPVKVDALARLTQLIASCPDRGEPRCGCRAHRELGRQDAQGRWQVPAEFGVRFTVEI